jgi:glucose-6-phosphate 1-dehydrogenase
MLQALYERGIAPGLIGGTSPVDKDGWAGVPFQLRTGKALA